MQLAQTAFDLVLILDVIADAPTFEMRRRFACEILASLDSGLTANETLNVGVIAYADRDPLPSAVRTVNKPLQICHLGPSRSIPQFLATVEPQSAKQLDFAAALEEALADLKRENWRPSSRRILLTLGSRPPHPLEGTALPALRPSPVGHDWQALFDEYIAAWGLRTWSVLFPIYWPGGALPRGTTGYTALCWDLLGRLGVFLPEVTTPGHIATCILADARAAQRMPSAAH